jgi:ABC-type uncharacterized transport system substrate-binding protein
MPDAMLKRMRRAGLAAAACGLWAGPALAHPHVFIDTGIEIGFDEAGRIAAVQVVWVYDEFYSLMAIADYGLDPGFTGTLTEPERTELAEIYSNWQPGYEGDLYPVRDGTPLSLSAPFDFSADYREGRIVITHRRTLETPVRPVEGPVVFKVYDPTYYTAYTIAAPPQLRGAEACSADVILPDFSYAAEQLQAAMSEMLAGAGDEFDLEEDFPPVGADFAEEVHVTCAARS